MHSEEQQYKTGIARAKWMAIVFAVVSLVAGIVGTMYQDRGMQAEQAPPTTRVEYAVSGTSTSVSVTFVTDLA